MENFIFLAVIYKTFNAVGKECSQQSDISFEVPPLMELQPRPSDIRMQSLNC